jgi:transcriptional regulator with XRE-family HTH domain
VGDSPEETLMSSFQDEENSEADRNLTRHIDVLLGAQLRAIRMVARQRQEDIGAALGVSKGQIQKYENGSNRIPASRLWQLCNVLGVNIAEVYQALPWNVPGPATPAGVGESAAAFDHEASDLEVEALASAARMLSPASRRLALAAVRGMTEAETRGLPRGRRRPAPTEISDDTPEHSAHFHRKDNMD